MDLNTLRLLGFDDSIHVPFTREYKVRCTQCQAACVNGVPTHEHGCPNAVHECKGCNTLVSMNVRYCEDCK